MSVPRFVRYTSRAIDTHAGYREQRRAAEAEAEELRKALDAAESRAQAARHAAEDIEKRVAFVHRLAAYLAAPDPAWEAGWTGDRIDDAPAIGAGWKTKIERMNGTAEIRVENYNGLTVTSTVTSRMLWPQEKLEWSAKEGGRYHGWENQRHRSCRKADNLPELIREAVGVVEFWLDRLPHPALAMGLEADDLEPVEPMDFLSLHIGPTDFVGSFDVACNLRPRICGQDGAHLGFLEPSGYLRERFPNGFGDLPLASWEYDRNKSREDFDDEVRTKAARMDAELQKHPEIWPVLLRMMFTPEQEEPVLLLLFDDEGSYRPGSFRDLAKGDPVKAVGIFDKYPERFAPVVTRDELAPLFATGESGIAEEAFRLLRHYPAE